MMFDPSPHIHHNSTSTLLPTSRHHNFTRSPNGDSLEEAEGDPAQEEADGGDEAADVGDEGQRKKMRVR